MGDDQTHTFDSSKTNMLELPQSLRDFHAQLPFALPLAGTTITSEATGIAYTIGDEISQGFFGVAYRCVDAWNNSLVAKVMKPRGAAFHEVERRVLSEAASLDQSRHPNIIHIYDAFVYEGACYIIVERCDNTITSMFRPDFDGAYWIKALSRCVLQALHFIHLRGLAHCDVHMRNVFFKFIADEILPNEHTALTFKLGDFGLARQVGDLSHEGTFLNFIRPPEAIDPIEYGPLDHRADIYQAGLLFLQFLLGREIMFTQEEILNGRPRQLALQLPAPYGAAIEKMLRRHVISRSQSALDCWHDLNVSTKI